MDGKTVFDGLVGLVIDRDVAEADVRASAAKAGLERVRVMRPGCFGDCQFDEDRLTLYVDWQGQIERVSFG
jgi:hypothetical protein